MNKTEKNTKVLMDADFSFLLGKIELCDNVTQEQALKLVEKLKTVKPRQRKCLLDISVEYTTASRIDKDGKKYSFDRLVIYPTVPNSMKCCKCNKTLTDRERNKKCAENIKSGNCCDPHVIATIGRILLPDVYFKKIKEKQK